MATRDKSGQVTETPGEATQAENSKNSYHVLQISMALSVIAAIALFWYFDVFSDHSLLRKPAQ